MARTHLPPADVLDGESAGALSVLLVDDCELQQVLACNLLARFNIQPSIGNDGAEAVELARNQRFDLVLMDIEMPRMDGFAATLLIRQAEWAVRCATRRPVPILAHTTADNRLPSSAWLEFGFDGLLPKPCAEAEFAKALTKWCGHLFSNPAPHGEAFRLAS